MRHTCGRRPCGAPRRLVRALRAPRAPPWRRRARTAGLPPLPAPAAVPGDAEGGDGEEHGPERVERDTMVHFCEMMPILKTFSSSTSPRDDIDNGRKDEVCSFGIWSSNEQHAGDSTTLAVATSPRTGHTLGHRQSQAGLSHALAEREGAENVDRLYASHTSRLAFLSAMRPIPSTSTA